MKHLKAARNPILRIFRSAMQYQHTDYDASRRLFLKRSAQTAAFLSLSGVAAACAPIAKLDRTYKVAILGAGLAGLTAAYTLQKRGLYADVYEATTQVGGRVRSAHNLMGEGLVSELGGEYINSNHDVMLGLAKELGLSLWDTHAASEAHLIKSDYFIAGERYNEAQIWEAFKDIAPRVQLDANLISERFKWLAEDKEIKRLDKLSISEYLEQIGLKQGWLRTLLETAFTSEMGLEAEQQSALNMLTYVEPNNKKQEIDFFADSDERYKIVGGNAQIPQKLAEKLGEQLHFEHHIEAITENQAGRYQLHFKNEKKADYDVVICALPFSVLRQIDLQIALPETKKLAIQNLGYGTNAKLLLGFDERIWRKKGYKGYLFHDHLHNAWDNTMMQNNNQGTGGFTFFIGGHNGAALSPDFSTEALTEIDKVYPNMKTAFNQKKAAFNWFRFPTAQGSYACYKVGQWTSVLPYISQPIGNFLFVGEHCSYEHQGYMNGAAESGMKVAKSVIKKLRQIG
ncbi:MAG: FAD-dependent oxidoreductase [Bernardetiaceae bacterium]|nr:FAD-dependent oxidoreductase [Bernardetiaceae bacterium]